MKLWQKIMVAPVVSMLFLAMLGAVSYWGLTTYERTLADIYTNRFASYQSASQAAQVFSEVHANVYRLFTSAAELGPDKISQIGADQKRRIAGLQQSIMELAKRAGVPEDERNLIEGVMRKFAQYRQHIETAIDMTQLDAASGAASMHTADKVFLDVLKDLRDIVDMEKKAAEAGYRSAERTYGQVVTILVGILVAALLFSAAIAILMSRVIVRALAMATGLAGRIAEGDLSDDIEASGRDELGQLLKALKEMSRSLRHIV